MFDCDFSAIQLRTGDGDCQAIFCNDGRGAHVYNNCLLEAATENIIYGGAVPSIFGLVTQNIEFRRCYFTKDLAWKVWTGSGSTHAICVKNIFEIKNAKRVYSEGCLFENHWDALQSQLFAIVCKSATSPGSVDEFVPQAISEDCIFENCTIQHIYGFVTGSIDNYDLGAFSGLKPNGTRFINCLVDDMGPTDWSYNDAGDQSRIFQPNNCEGIETNHCTIIAQTDAQMTAFMVTNNNYGFTIKDSILPLLEAVDGYGIFGGGGFTGYRALNYGTGGTVGSSIAKDASARWSLENNVLVNLAGVSGYPDTSPDVNEYPVNYAAVGFENFAGGDYSLDAASDYKNTASDGTDPGINKTVLDARTATVVAGTGWDYEAGEDPPAAVAAAISGSISMQGAVSIQ